MAVCGVPSVLHTSTDVWEEVALSGWDFPAPRRDRPRRPEPLLLPHFDLSRLRQPDRAGLYGPNKTCVLRCSTCKARFSERKGTPLFDARSPAAKVVSVLVHVAEGIGTRTTARTRAADGAGPARRTG